MKEADLLRSAIQSALISCDKISIGAQNTKAIMQDLLREANEMAKLPHEKYDVESDLQKVYCELFRFSQEASIELETARKNDYSLEHIAYLEGILSGIAKASKAVKHRNKRAKNER